MKKTIGAISALLVVMLLTAACGSGGPNAGREAGPGNADDGSGAGEPIEITFFSNNPDRTGGQGKAEQLLIEQYMSENPNIRIKSETLSPDPQFQDKLKIYNVSNTLPDVTMMWGGARYLSPYVKNDSLVEFSREDFAGQGFIDAAFDSFTMNGKLYGIPKNTDFLVLYVNKKILADNGLAPPKTESDLFRIAEKLNGTGIVPMALDGRDAWPLGLLFDAVVSRQTGGFETYHKAVDRTGSFNDPNVVASAQKLQEMVKAGLFGEGFLNLDYGAARNLFGQGKAAMYLMGQWEMGMAKDANFPQEVRDNMAAVPYPASDDGKSPASDLLAWFGGGYSVASKSKHAKEAKDFAIWLFKKENWAKTVWENGITFPAQAYDEFVTGEEAQLQQDLTAILKNADNISGANSQDRFSASTSKSYLDAITELLALKVTPEHFAQSIDAIAAKSYKELHS
ncbi:ABC transporter substrate-binding protein [Paenibacillus sp. NPDC058071]|uniref:ABC transporter substrate-binding protein n=1 Tax=Paenibacillus sp. NPDC058071 TaxID=3346326 RepID=UPI0036DE6BDD